MQWQHGKFVKNADGSLTLEPFKVDGRQLLSKPCDGKNAIYTRYNQTETFQVRFEDTGAYTVPLRSAGHVG